MEEILYELREHSAGLNAGRWDYIFSVIKNFRRRGRDFVLPDRAEVTMTVPFMRAYTELLVATCHRRGAHAIGGMAAFIPSRRDPQVNEVALDQGARGQGAGGRRRLRRLLGGAPGPGRRSAGQVFDAVLGDRPNQLDRLRDDVAVTAADLLARRHDTGPGHRRRACGPTSPSRCATSTRGWAAPARWRSAT